MDTAAPGYPIEPPGSDEAASARRASPKPLVDHFFRHEYARLISILLRILGNSKIDQAEDIAQEAIAKALQVWPLKGIPENPTAWIIRVAKNIALDGIRHRRMKLEKESEVISHLRNIEEKSAQSSINSDTEVGDDLLNAMLFVCDPILPRRAQVALALKILCGFSVSEIARAFLTNKSAIERTISRAKQKLRRAKEGFERSPMSEVDERLDSVVQTLYFLFNEGYYASSGRRLVKEELCQQAIRLAVHLVRVPMGDKPQIHALLSLMLFMAGRFPARVDDEGNLLTLEEQDRSKWNWELIRMGLIHFERSATGESLSEFHLQAAIAFAHCEARTHQQVDWSRIIEYYDKLVEVSPSPIVLMNRSVAIAELRGAQAGLDELERVSAHQHLAGYHLLHAIQGVFHARLDQKEAAIACFRKALSLTTMEVEINFLTERLEECLDPKTG